MARKYTRDNRGRFASTGKGATARGGRLKTASGGKRETQTIKAPKQKQAAAPKSAKPMAATNAPKRLSFKLAYHGTSQEAAQAIRKGGYKESKYGTYGAGVYATTDRKAARAYASWRSAGGKDKFGESFPASAKGPAVLVHRVPKNKVSKGDPYSYENRQIVGNGGARRLGKDVTNDRTYMVMGKALADRSLVKPRSTVRRPRRK